MLKKLSVITEGYSVNIDVHGDEVALIDMQSFRGNDVVDVVEIVASKEELDELIRMLEFASKSME